MRYDEVVQWSTEGGSIRLAMLGEDQETHSLEVSAGCARALTAALASELEKIDPESKDQQLIRPQSIQTGQTYKGEPLLLLTLTGGVEMPLVFSAQSLDAMIAELQNLKGHLQGGSQVRWS